MPYGESISRNGLTVWVGLDGERVMCVAATAHEARSRYREIRKSMAARRTRGGSNVEADP